VALLVRWLREDLLDVAGPDHATRCALYDWVVAELPAREQQCPHRIRLVQTLLENQRDALLALAAGLDQELAAVAAEFSVPVATVRSILLAQALPLMQSQRWQRPAAFWQQLGALRAVARSRGGGSVGVVRASRVIENLNS
jgi:hypothetical protein